MFFLNLSVGEFLALFSTISAGVVALYLLDRSRRRQVVSTLRFWRPAEFPTDVRQRRKIQQPWSLALQLISIALLLLAIAQLRLGSRDNAIRDHVLILDTSAWMGAKTAKGTLIQDARAQAMAWLNTLPPSDRVMLVRADSLSTPVTRFETKRETIARAIQESQPGSSALRLGKAVRFAQQLQATHAKGGGEIVFTGAARVVKGDEEWKPPPNLRVLNVTAPVANTGIRRVGLRRSVTDPDVWDISVVVRNYGSQPRSVPVGLQVGNSPAGTRQVTLPPNAEQEIVLSYRTRAAAILEARILAGDSFPQDDRVTVEIPQQKRLRVAAYTSAPALLRPVLSANPNVDPVFAPPASYKVNPDVDLVILDGFVPPAPPSVAAIYIEPPAAQSPVAVTGTRARAKLDRWSADAILGAGLRTRDVELATAQIFRPAASDLIVADTDAGPVIVARPGAVKIAVFGFHPPRSSMRFELATPLVFANVIRWMAPGSFRQWELAGGATGAVSARLEGQIDPAQVRVLNQDGAEVPYKLDNGHLSFFAGEPGMYRAVAGDREIAFSLTVPEIGDAPWEIPAGVPRGVPRKSAIGVSSRDIWYWLAIAGGLGLLAEWVLFGQHRTRTRSSRAPSKERSAALRQAS